MRLQTQRLVGCGLMLLITVGNARAQGDLRVIQAVRKGDAEVVRALLQQKVDVNVTQADGATALHWATYQDDLAKVTLLLRAGADPKVANLFGATPLYLACENGNALIVAQLLRAGASANTALPSGETALHTAARSGSPGAVKGLLAAGADINARENLEGQTPLMWAVSQRHPDVVQTLIEARADIRARSRVRAEVVIQRSAGGEPSDDAGGEIIDEGGLTPFLFAARVGDVESARLLLAAGAEINETRPDGASALVVAAHSGHVELTKFLLSQGADVNAAGAGYTALHAAVLRGLPDMVQDLIVHGANTNQKLEKGTVQRRQSKWYTLSPNLIGATPFFLSAKYDEPEIMRLLVAAGADPLAGLENGQTPLMVAAGMGAGLPGRVGSDRRNRTMDTADSDADIATLNKDLRIYGSGSGIEVVKMTVALGNDVNAVALNGDTALHAAAGHGYDSVIRFLVEKGAKLDAKNKRGLTPLNVAESLKDADDPTIGTTTVAVVRELLKEHGQE